MESRGIAFFLGAVAGLGTGIAGVLTLRPQLTKETSKTSNHEERDGVLFRYGHPEAHISTHSYTSHFLTYDRSKKVPVWVAESITSDMVHSKEANRKKSTFQPDTSLPESCCSSNDDYRKSGWSRGHMAPAGNYKHIQRSMDDTFYLTNIVPQDVDNNSGYWNSIEDYCRKLTKKYKEVSIVSGPLFLPETEQTTGKTFVKYQVIGRNNVSVPTHLFKIILADDGQGTMPTMGVFVVPNRPIRDVNLTQFQVSLEELEAYTGTKFHSKLDRKKVYDLCTTDTCKLVSTQQWNIMTYQKRVQAAQTISQLEGIWQEIKTKKIQPDQRLEDLYKKRKLELDT